MTAGSAAWIAAVRARESERPDRLFDDPFAAALAGAAGFATMARSEALTGPKAFIPVRVRWFDDLTLRLAGCVGASTTVSRGSRQVTAGVR